MKSYDAIAGNIQRLQEENPYFVYTWYGHMIMELMDMVHGVMEEKRKTEEYYSVKCVNLNAEHEILKKKYIKIHQLEHKFDGQMILHGICPDCGSSEYLCSENGNKNCFCGKCGQKLIWKDDENGRI